MKNKMCSHYKYKKVRRYGKNSKPRYTKCKRCGEII